MSTHSFFKAETWFVWLAVLYGCLFVFVNPPVQGPDENVHCYRAYQVSVGQWASVRVGDQAGGDIPKNLFKTVNNFERIYTRSEKKLSICEIHSFLPWPLAPKDTISIPFSNTALFSPIPYLPQALGMWVGRKIQLSPLILTYLGRLFSLLIWTLLVYCAIRATPFMKWLLLLLALTPMSLTQAASLSADAFTNALSFLLTALLLQCAFDDQIKVTSRRLSALWLIAALLSLSKQLYILLAFLYFLIPVAKVGSKKKYFGWFLWIMLSCVALEIFWGHFIHGFYRSFFPGISPRDQAHFVLTHLWQFTSTILKTLWHLGPSYIGEFVGKFGWLDTPLPRALVLTYTLTLLGVAFFDQNPEIKINLRQRLLLAVLFILGVLLICGALYLHWSPVGAEMIGGIQGRYFIPFAPLFFLTFYGLIPGWKSSPMLLRIIAAILPFCALSISLLVLIRRYYE